MKPDASKHNPDPDYLRSLIEGAGSSQNEVAKRIGISARSMRYYLAGERPIPYTIQFAVESLCK